jgi:L-ascorbate metabolism protein UlaG (beta-lactamase superfamily)
LVLDTGQVVYVDPYLSDCLSRTHGWNRLMPVPFAPEEADCDLVLITHAHPDHLDPDTVPGLARATSARFVIPSAYASRLEELGVEAGRIVTLDRGQSTRVDGLHVEALPAFHQHPRNPQPDAVGYVVRHGEVSVYHAGDTAYTLEVRDAAAAAGPITVALLPINGQRCCLTAEDAVFLAADARARVLVPMHYGMFAENTADPYQVVAHARRLAPDLRVLVIPFLGGVAATEEGVRGPLSLLD